ncbi:BZ3501_MvSof-1269-A2-R1_Chr3-2g06132 [Microbotryum saponariae]|nr:BZ3501_MvSof-1269-A2-R1_Chr3-2g06132 [Microbotryum saponariae]
MSAPDRSHLHTPRVARFAPPNHDQHHTPLRHVHSLVISRLRDRLVQSNLQFDPQEVSADGLNCQYIAVSSHWYSRL